MITESNHPSPTLGGLSTELHLMIFEHLDPVSSTCLGLTRKDFYVIHKEKHGKVSLFYSGYVNITEKGVVLTAKADVSDVSGDTTRMSVNAWASFRKTGRGYSPQVNGQPPTLFEEEITIQEKSVYFKLHFYLRTWMWESKKLLWGGRYKDTQLFITQARMEEEEAKVMEVERHADDARDTINAFKVLRNETLAALDDSIDTRLEFPRFTLVYSRHQLFNCNILTQLQLFNAKRSSVKVRGIWFLATRDPLQYKAWLRTVLKDMHRQMEDDLLEQHDMKLLGIAKLEGYN